MSIACLKRRRKQFEKKFRHLAKLGRPGTPKKYGKEESAKRLARVIANARKVAQKSKK